MYNTRRTDSHQKQTTQQPFRFPAFEVIDIRPDIAPTNALDRLWLRITAPKFNSQVDLKVSYNRGYWWRA